VSITVTLVLLSQETVCYQSTWICKKYWHMR